GKGVVVNDAVSVAVRGDGKILVGAQDGSVVRLNADGSPDTSFGGGDGRAEVGGDVVLRHLAAAPGDKVVASFDRSGQTALEVFRLNADGSPDTSFSADGFAVVNVLAGAAGGANRVELLVTQRHAPQVRVDQHPGCVDHPM
ncbi:MAG: hypothetical protein KY463_14810, partial [Actinobacteria bacterium]|nr:hypothetical protein [Actinomycetota bacterium]